MGNHPTSKAQATLDSLMQLKGFGFMSNKQGQGVLMLYCQIAQAPLQLLGPEFKCNDLAAFEDLAGVVAFLRRSLNGTDSLAEYCSLELQLNTDVFMKLQTVALRLLAEQEDKCIKPKMAEILLVLMKDPAYWQQVSSSMDTGRPIFVEEAQVEELCAKRLEIHADYGRCDLLVEEAINHRTYGLG